MNRILIGLIFFLGVHFAHGQSLLDKYKNHPKSEIDVETSLVTEDVILISPEKPLIIKTPDKNEVFKIYVFTKIWDNGSYKGFVGLSDDPFKPNLVTTTPGQTEIDRLQLLGNWGDNRPDYSVKEEVRISSDQEIILTASITRWSLDSNGMRIIGSDENEIKTTKYKINDKGKLEKL